MNAWHSCGQHITYMAAGVTMVVMWCLAHIALIAAANGHVYLTICMHSSTTRGTRSNLAYTRYVYIHIAKLDVTAFWHTLLFVPRTRPPETCCHNYARLRYNDRVFHQQAACCAGICCILAFRRQPWWARHLVSRPCTLCAGNQTAWQPAVPWPTSSSQP